MKLRDEESVMKVLEIDSWRNLSREKFMKFASLIPDANRETLEQIAKKMPLFVDFAKDVLDKTTNAFEISLESNKHNMSKLHESFSETRKILSIVLDKPDLSEIERVKAMDMLLELLEMEKQADKSNKEFISKCLQTVAYVGCGLLAYGLEFALKAFDKKSKL